MSFHLAHNGEEVAFTETTEEVAVDEHVEEAEPSGIGTLGLNPTIFVAQLVNFTIVLLVLWWFAYKPIVRFLEERHAKIEKSVKDAEEIAERMNRMDTEREEAMRQAGVEAQRVIDEAMKTAEARKTEMIAKAKADVERVVAQGKAQLMTERTTIMQDARKELADIAVAATKKILTAEINEKKSLSLAEEVVRKMT